MVDCVRKMVAKKSLKCGRFGLSELQLFLFVFLLDWTCCH